MIFYISAYPSIFVIILRKKRRRDFEGPRYSKLLRYGLKHLWSKNTSYTYHWDSIFGLRHILTQPRRNTVRIQNWQFVQPLSYPDVQWLLGMWLEGVVWS